MSEWLMRLNAEKVKCCDYVLGTRPYQLTENLVVIPCLLSEHLVTLTGRMSIEHDAHPICLLFARIFSDRTQRERNQCQS